MAPLIYLDRSEVRDGRLDELREAFGRLAAFVDENEPWLVSYVVCFSADGSESAVLSVHADEDSLRRHLEVIRDRLAPFAELLLMRSIEVFGDISDDLRATLQQKADLLGAGMVSVNPLDAGFLHAAATGDGQQPDA